MQILFTALLFWHCQALATSLPLPPADLPTGWQRIEIPEVGTIDIPPSMEVRDGGRNAGEIIIQQKGLNESDPIAENSYVRIAVVTDVSNFGEVESLDSLFGFPADELQELSKTCRAYLKETFPEILQWNVPLPMLVNGMIAIRLDYKYQHENNPTRLVIYIFQNVDRIHYLVMSYREAERDKWLPDFPTILSSFRITNIRGQEVVKPRQ